MKSQLLAALLMLGLSLVGCNGYDRGVREPPQAVPITCKRQEVYLYVNNDSYIDTLPSAKLVIDDSGRCATNRTHQLRVWSLYKGDSVV
jgi:hypothetical protein